MSRLSVLGSLTLLGSLAAGCIDDNTPPVLIDNAVDVDDTYLFGYTPDELLAIKRVSQMAMSDAAWLEAHRGGFDCARYRDLCKMVGYDHALRAIESGYRIALATGDVAQVRAAQNAIIDAGKAEMALAPIPSYRDTEDDCEFGNSGGSYRLCASATATEMWPSLEMRADGHCRTQVNSFGWQSKTSDEIEGTMTAEFVSGGTVDVDIRGPRTVFIDNRLDFAEFQQSADSVTVTVECAAEDGTWSATADVANFTT